MRAILSNFWDDWLSSLWFVPALLVASGVLLSVVMVSVDQVLLPDLGEEAPILFGATADAARTVLSVIAGSLVTVISIAFSVTLVVIQQASSQYSPRLLRNFTSDRGNQVVLGTYIGTFIYALLVMRQVRSSNGAAEAFIPALSLTVAIILALISLGLLVYFIHHTVRSIEVATILQSIRKEIDAEIEVMFPSTLGAGAMDAPTFEAVLQSPGARAAYEHSVLAQSPGYLRQIDEERLVEAIGERIQFVLIRPRIGEFLPRGAHLAQMWSEAPIGEERLRSAQSAFIISIERSLRQDPLFGIRQIVDIALKALSPGVNDSTTAEQCISSLGDIVGELAQRAFPSPLRVVRGRVRLLANRPSFADFVEESFGQIRRTADDNLHVTLRVLATLRRVAERVPNSSRAEAVGRQALEVLAKVDDAPFSAADKKTVEDEASALLLALQAHLPSAA